MSMNNFQQQQAARAEAYEKAHHHLTRASMILEGIGQAAEDNALLNPPQVLALLQQASTEAATGHGWAVLASAPRPSVMRGSPLQDAQINWPKP